MEYYFEHKNSEVKAVLNDDYEIEHFELPNGPTKWYTAPNSMYAELLNAFEADRND